MSRPFALPPVVNSCVCSSVVERMWIGSVVVTALTNDSALLGPKLSASHTAPWMPTRPQAFISAMCRIVISLKPTTSFGCLPAASTSKPSAIR